MSLFDVGKVVALLGVYGEDAARLLEALTGGFAPLHGVFLAGGRC